MASLLRIGGDVGIDEWIDRAESSKSALKRSTIREQFAQFLRVSFEWLCSTFAKESFQFIQQFFIFLDGAFEFL
jgi:hypothetical protein